MVVRSRVLALALVLVAAPMLGALAHTPHDDAGAGADAPDRPADALNVSPGSHVGNLTPGVDGDGHHDDYDTYENDSIEKDADWYRTNASDETEQIACTQASFAPDETPHNETRVHIREPSLEAAQLNETTTTEGTTLAHVGPSPSGTLAGLTHLDPPRVTEYTLDVEVTTLDEASGAGASDEIPGPCFGGNVEDNEIHEWTFEAEEGDLLYVSLGTELARMDELSLEAPNGSDLGSIISDDEIVIGAETLPDTGNYTLSLEAGDTGLLTTASSDYLIGFNLVDDPEEGENGCRPNCMDA